jgi:hypothetical protein
VIQDIKISKSKKKNTEMARRKILSVKIENRWKSDFYLGNTISELKNKKATQIKQNI